MITTFYTKYAYSPETPDKDRRLYFYYDNDQWLESNTLPAYLSKHFGEPVELRMNTLKPYEFHTQVIEKYPHPGMEVTKTIPIFQIWSGRK